MEGFTFCDVMKKEEMEETNKVENQEDSEDDPVELVEHESSREKLAVSSEAINGIEKLNDATEVFNGNVHKLKNNNKVPLINNTKTNNIRNLTKKKVELIIDDILPEEFLNNHEEPSDSEEIKTDEVIPEPESDPESITEDVIVPEFVGIESNQITENELKTEEKEEINQNKEQEVTGNDHQDEVDESENEEVKLRIDTDDKTIEKNHLEEDEGDKSEHVQVLRVRKKRKNVNRAEEAKEIGAEEEEEEEEEEDDDDRLDEDDYDLLEENLGYRINRRKYRRVRRTVDSDDEEDSREQIANQLFDGESDHENNTEKNQEAEPLEFMSEGDSESDTSDIDDFIEDSGYDPSQKSKQKKRVQNPAVQVAREIFGVDDMDEFFDEDKENEYKDDDDSDEDYIEEPKSKRFRKRIYKKSIFELYEPVELERNFFTEKDIEIRNKDIPERMQLRSVPVTSIPEDSYELDNEAEWIFEQGFIKPTISTQPELQLPDDKVDQSTEIIKKIKNVLNLIRNEHLEVPFILFYRKEYFLPELNVKDLWKIYRFDAKWCVFNERRENLLKLIVNLKNFQQERAIYYDYRPVTDQDIEYVKTCQTNEELNDVYQFLMLHYSEDISIMRQSMQLEEQEKRSNKRMEQIKRRSNMLLEAKRKGIDPPSKESDSEDDTPVFCNFIKHPIRSGIYTACCKAGLNSFAEKFGLTPDEFGKNLKENTQYYEIKQESTGPKEIASEYLGSRFKTCDEVIEAVKLMIAIKLSHNPLVKRSIRKVYMKNIKLSVKPKRKCIKIIDEEHDIYSMKYLKDKPISEFTKDQFLKLTVAENDKLIDINFSNNLEGSSAGSSYLDEITNLIIKDDPSELVKEWNELRKSIVELALKKILMPLFEKELRLNLIAEAQEYIITKCCEKIHDWIKVAPYTYKFKEAETDEDWDTSDGVRVMSIAYALDYFQTSYACLVDVNGKCQKYLRLPHILKKKTSTNETDIDMKESEMLLLENFILNNKPHVIVVGGESRDAKAIVEDLKECLTLLNEEHNFPHINIEIIDNNLSKVYAKSHISTIEFHDYPEVLKQAISLARRIQDPLIEFTRLCNIDKYILCLKYHPLQEQILKEDLIDRIYEEFINRVNEVGVDINNAIKYNYVENLIQFVSGLGPRKGLAITKAIKQTSFLTAKAEETSGQLKSRTDLVANCCLGPTVFINCAGFIKINLTNLEKYGTELDTTRIHPESYDITRKMIFGVLDYKDQDFDPEVAILNVLEDPKCLKRLDLKAFANETMAIFKENKIHTVKDILKEFVSPYKDFRVPYSSLSPEEEFYVLTKETPETLYEGKLILAMITGISYKKPQEDDESKARPKRNEESGLWICPFCMLEGFDKSDKVKEHYENCPGKPIGFKIRLDNGISGFIHSKNISDKRVNNPEDKAAIGQTIQCRIIKIQPEVFRVECTSKTFDLSDPESNLRPKRDDHYDLEAEEKDLQSEYEFKLQRLQHTYIKRVIIHEHFHNVDYRQAVKMMEKMSQGEVIIRPSSKASDHLTATWKVTDGIYQHIDIEEQGKPNAFSLGAFLFIKYEEFEDLNDIISTHINPMASFAADILKYKYYNACVNGDEEEAEYVLKEKQNINPAIIPYIISACKNHPGKFLLSYLPRDQCIHEYFSVNPDGYRFRGEMFTNINDLIDWFKNHFRDPIPVKKKSKPIRKALAFNINPKSFSTSKLSEIQRRAQHLSYKMVYSVTPVGEPTNQFDESPASPEPVTEKAN